MTKQQFKDLKVGDRVYIPHGKGRVIDTEVLNIDRLFGRITVLLGGDKSHSYRYIRKSISDRYKISCSVGIVNSDFSWAIRL